MSPEKLAYMANQIGRFFAHEGEEKAAASVADHLIKFWDPRMREQFLGDADRLREMLLPEVRRAVALLAEKQGAS